MTMQPSSVIRRYWHMGALVVLGTILLLVSPAQASLFLIFKGEGSKASESSAANGGEGVGAPGRRIEARTGGQGAMGDIKTMSAFLVPGNRVPDSQSLHSRRDVFPLGRVVADTEGNGHLEFMVPEVQPGAYRIVVFCPACAAFSAGRNVLPVASFRIVPTSQLPMTGSRHAAWTGGLAPFVIALGPLSLVLASRKGFKGLGTRN